MGVVSGRAKEKIEEGDEGGRQREFNELVLRQPLNDLQRLGWQVERTGAGVPAIHASPAEVTR